MRFVRFLMPGSERERWGMIEDGAVVELDGPVPGPHKRTELVHSLSDIRLLAPVQPSKIVALGTNFKAHAAEMGKEVPAEPKIFLKAPSALVGPGQPIVLPAVEGNIEHEAELAVVVGRRAHRVSAQHALDHVFGYTCFNDVTARKLQRIDGVFARAKGFDTFAPCGPWIETEANWQDLVVEGWLNGQRKQRGPLNDLIFSVPQALSFISGIMTLFPGDLIAMGTPEGVSPLAPGDEVEIRIDGIGSLTNPVTRDEPAS